MICSNHMHYSSAGWANHISDQISATSCLDPWSGWVALILILFLINMLILIHAYNYKINIYVSFFSSESGNQTIIKFSKWTYCDK